MEKLYEKFLYPSKKDFEQRLKDQGIYVQQREIDDFYAKKSSSAVFNNPANEKRGHYSTSGYDYIVYIDLMDFSRFKRFNHNHSWILTAIEWRTRYGFAVPLKRKAATEVAAALESILNQLPHKEDAYIRVVSDQGTEFMGAVQKMLDAFTCRKIFRLFNVVGASNRKSTMPVERFNQTILLYLRKYWEENDQKTGKATRNWESVLPALLERYNTHKHETTQQKPADLLNNLRKLKELPPIEIDINQVVSRFKVGDMVRVRLEPKTYEKKTLAKRWSEPYKIIAINMPVITLSNKKDYYEDDLKPSLDTAASLDAAVSLDTSDIIQNEKTNRFERLQAREFKPRDEVQSIQDGQVILKDRLRPRNYRRTNSVNEKRISKLQNF